MRIDPHVHCRDGRQAHKETIAHVFRLCDAQGVDVIFDMPNTDPPILGEEDLERRLAMVPRDCFSRYRVYLGLTTDEKQSSAAAVLASQCRQVAGLKLFAGQSEGSLGVPLESSQKRIYEILAAAGYTGLLAVHCEKDSLCRRAFDPQKPISHCAARPVEAETQAIADQIGFARAAHFRGVLHICHVSAAASLDLIRSERAGLKLTCGATPHHLLWTDARMQDRDGVIYKVNPPLRGISDCVALRQGLKNGDIDWIESDHAPHALSEKLYPPYSSGYPSLCLYGNLVSEILPAWGLDEKRIESVTCGNIKKYFTERGL